MKAFLKATLKILISSAALYYVFTKIEFSQVLKILSNVNYLLLFISLIFLFFLK